MKKKSSNSFDISEKNRKTIGSKTKKQMNRLFLQNGTFLKFYMIFFLGIVVFLSGLF